MLSETDLDLRKALDQVLGQLNTWDLLRLRKALDLLKALVAEPFGRRRLAAGPCSPPERCLGDPPQHAG